MICLSILAQVLRLLKSLLRSKRPLTDVFLRKNETVNTEKEEEDGLVEAAQIKLQAEDEAAQAKKITLKLLQDKITEKILYTEAGDDFVDVLLSFLTFPLGSIVKLLNKQSSLSCVDNLYNSVDFLAAAGDYFKSGDCKNMLLAPKLYPHFNCSNQVLRIEANIPGTCNGRWCKTCWDAGTYAATCTKCQRQYIDIAKLTEINPKLANSGTEIGGGYSKKLARFMVTDEMVVAPMSPVSGIDLIKELKVPIRSLVEKEVTLGEAEVKFSYSSIDFVFKKKKKELQMNEVICLANFFCYYMTQVLNLLKACLVSSNALNRVFSSPNKWGKLV